MTRVNSQIQAACLLQAKHRKILIIPNEMINYSKHQSAVPAGVRHSHRRCCADTTDRKNGTDNEQIARVQQNCSFCVYIIIVVVITAAAAAPSQPRPTPTSDLFYRRSLQRSNFHSDFTSIARKQVCRMRKLFAGWAEGYSPTGLALLNKSR